MRRAVLVITFIIGAILAPRLASAATLYLSPPQVTAAVGETVPVSVVLDSQGTSINVVSAALSFPTDQLEAVNVSTGQSFLTLWAEGPTIDAQRGRIAFAGGVPNGTITLNAPVLSILFRVKSLGVARLRLDESDTAVYQNDGAGTRTPVTTNGATITGVNPNTLVPSVSSLDHQDESRWSAVRNVTFRWDVHAGAIYSFQLSRDALAMPDDTADVTNGTAAYPSLSDGIWYFTLKEKFGDDPWGPVARRRVMIDGTPPASVDAQIVLDTGQDEWLLIFNTEDQPSGIDHYEVRLKEPRFVWLPFFFRGEWRRATSPLSLGRHPILKGADILAIDLAGNVRIQKLSHPSLARTQRQFLEYLIAGLLIVLVVAFAIIKRRRRR